MSDSKKTAKKSARVKRSRLGRGLSALVDVPVVIEVEDSSRSDNLVPGSAVVAGMGVGVGAMEGTGEAISAGGNGDVDGGADEETRASWGGGLGVVAGNVVAERIEDIEVGLIGVNRDQPRRVFDEQALSALSGSILEHGLMQPVVVRRAADGDERYELIAGERRWRASMLAGLSTIRAIVRDVDDETSAQLALIENVQREDLNVVELAEGYRVLSDRYSMTQEKIAKVVGVSRSLVANTVRLLDLPDEVRDLIVGGKLSSGHGKVLLSLGVPEKQRKFAARCLKEGWNVRQLQRACDDSVDGGGVDGVVKPKAAINPEEDRALSVLRDLEKRVGEELGTRVKIRTDKSRTRGRVVIEFFDLDQFDGLLGRLGVKSEG